MALHFHVLVLLSLLLPLFQEAVRVKRLSNKRAAIRDLLFSSIADYNRLASKASPIVLLLYHFRQMP